jgi:PKD repeat protein
MKKNGVVIAIFICLLLTSLTGCLENQPPSAKIIVEKDSGSAPFNVKFTAEASDSDGEIESYSWDFGDGETSSLKNPSHTFNESGTYIVTLTVSDNSGNSETNTTTIYVFTNTPPTAFASTSTTYGEVPLIVTFTGLGNDTDGSISSYEWSFGEGSTSNLQNPTHTYTLPGIYSVQLIVTDNHDSHGMDTISINVEKKRNHPPMVSPIANPTSGVVPLKVQFTGEATDSDGLIHLYQWDFKDGDKSGAKNPSHTFLAAGTYSVLFNVTDNEGASSYDIIQITVLEDTDRDGIPDLDDPDDDNDGFLDIEDLFPKKDAKVKIIVEKIKVIDEVDAYPENSDAEVYFEIDIEGSFAEHMPSNPTENYYSIDIGELKTINGFYIFDCDDNKREYTIDIKMWDYDGGIWAELVDINDIDTSNKITINYDVVSGDWTGDDNDGILDGSEDGTQQIDDNDAYVEYKIVTL